MPGSFFTILGFELAKARRSIFTWVVVLLPALASAGAAGAGALIRRVETAMAASGDGASAAAAEISAYPVFASSLGNGLATGGILLLLYSSMILANEGHWGTFKIIMIRPHPRWAWVAGKYALLLLTGLAQVAAVTAASALAGRLSGTFGAIAEEGYVIHEAGFMAKETARALLLVLPPMAALAAFGLAFSAMTDHSGTAASAALGAYVLLETAKGSGSGASLWLFNRFQPSLLDASYVHVLRELAKGMSDAMWEEGVIPHNLAAPAVWAAAGFAVALAVFRRRNFLV